MLYSIECVEKQHNHAKSYEEEDEFVNEKELNDGNDCVGLLLVEFIITDNGAKRYHGKPVRRISYFVWILLGHLRYERR